MTFIEYLCHFPRFDELPSLSKAILSNWASTLHRWFLGNVVDTRLQLCIIRLLFFIIVVTNNANANLLPPFTIETVFLNR